MASYELICIFKKMSRADLINSVKRVAENVWSKDGVVRKIEYLGSQKLPYKIRNRHEINNQHVVGSYFLYHFDVSAAATAELQNSFPLDSDIVRAKIFPKQVKIDKNYQCTLEEELRPPVFRESVQKLMKEGVKESPKFDKGTQQV